MDGRKIRASKMMIENARKIKEIKNYRLARAGEYTCNYCADHKDREGIVIFSVKPSKDREECIIKSCYEENCYKSFIRDIDSHSFYTAPL